MSFLNRRPGRLLAGVGLAGLAALLLIPAAAQPQNPNQNKQEVTIPTVDGVELKGTYYKSTGGKDAPVAILLHQYGQDRTKGDWDKLAKELQSKMRFAVLTFDFRGHGGSTSINPSVFWSMPHNSSQHITGRSTKKQTISYTAFKPAYKPYLVNDIAAARKFLDKKNDASECNTSNIFVIGAQEGALLGMLWVATEWQRDGVARQFGGAAPALAGQDIFGCTWLSVPRGQGTKWGSENWAQASPQLREKVPMCFFYGEKDTTGKASAEHFVNVALKKSNASSLNPDTFPYAIKGTQLAGIHLLGKPELKSDDYLFRYIEKALQRRGGNGVWQQRGTFPDVLVPIERVGAG